MTKIMIVDDEADIRLVVRGILEKEGYEVTEASGGKECLEMLKHDKPDLIILDIMMPEVDGWQVLKKIRGDVELDYTPVIMLTVKPLTDKTFQKRYIERLTDYISKPFTRERLLSSVKDALSTFSLITAERSRLKGIFDNLSEEHEEILKSERLHQNLLIELQKTLEDQAWKGTNGIAVLKELIENEEEQVEIYKKRREEIERLIESWSRR
ncbi:MAG: response regulator [Candidatus Hydrothermarchaeales archaeon]